MSVGVNMAVPYPIPFPLGKGVIFSVIKGDLVSLKKDIPSRYDVNQKFMSTPGGFVTTLGLLSVTHNKVNIFKWLLSQGLDALQKTSAGFNLFSEAARMSSVSKETTDLLFTPSNDGEYLNDQALNGGYNTVTHLAVISNNIYLLQKLLGMGSSLRVCLIKNLKGDTAMGLGIKLNRDNSTMARMLAKYARNVSKEDFTTTSDNDGYTLLELARNYKLHDVVDIMTSQPELEDNDRVCVLCKILIEETHKAFREANRSDNEEDEYAFDNEIGTELRFGDDLYGELQGVRSLVNDMDKLKLDDDGVIDTKGRGGVRVKSGLANTMDDKLDDIGGEEEEEDTVMYSVHEDELDKECEVQKQAQIIALENALAECQRKLDTNEEVHRDYVNGNEYRVNNLSKNFDILLEKLEAKFSVQVHSIKTEHETELTQLKAGKAELIKNESIMRKRLTKYELELDTLTTELEKKKSVMDEHLVRLKANTTVTSELKIELEEYKIKLNSLRQNNAKLTVQQRALDAELTTSSEECEQLRDGMIKNTRLLSMLRSKHEEELAKLGANFEDVVKSSINAQELTEKQTEERINQLKEDMYIEAETYADVFNKERNQFYQQITHQNKDHTSELDRLKREHIMNIKACMKREEELNTKLEHIWKLWEKTKP